MCARGIRSRRLRRSPKRSSAIARSCASIRRTGKNKFAIIQGEDELASMGIAIGAGWNGARSFTTTSGPGISLMAEFIGLAYFAEIPVVLIDVQRGGPSTGMPTRTQQSDVLSCAYASHGDTKHVLLFPEDPTECFEFTRRRSTSPSGCRRRSSCMTDLDIGMNTRLCEPFQWDDTQAYDRGKVMTYDDLESGRDFGRYLDVDGDGVPYRTYPGTHPTRGALLHARHDQGPLRALQRSRPGLHGQHAAAAAQVRNREDAGAEAAALSGGEARALRRDLLRLDQPLDAGSARRARRARHPRQRAAGARASRSRRRSPTSSPRTRGCS